MNSSEKEKDNLDLLEDSESELDGDSDFESFDLPVSDAGKLFDTDTGVLKPATRIVLVHLLQGPSIDGSRHRKLWEQLLANEQAIQSALSELFLNLVIDREQQVAFVRQADLGSIKVPTLLRRSPLTFIDSILLIFLRQRLSSADAKVERAVISKDEVIEYMSIFKQSRSLDEVLFRKRVMSSIGKLEKYGVLRAIKGTKDRLEISPTLKLLFTPEQIRNLQKIYKSFTQDESEINPDANQLLEDNQSIEGMILDTEGAN